MPDKICRTLRKNNGQQYTTCFTPSGRIVGEPARLGRSNRVNGASSLRPPPMYDPRTDAAPAYSRGTLPAYSLGSPPAYTEGAAPPAYRPTAKKLSKAVMIKELKARGVPGGNLTHLDREYLEERLDTRINPKLVADFDKGDLDRFIDFVRDKGVEMGLPPKKEKAITEANLALFSRRMYGIDNAYERGKIDDFLKQKVVQLARNVDKEFKTKFY